MSHFKIAAAQVASDRGDIDRNIATHAATIKAAAVHQVSVLVFPELSLTGYEPDLAAELAISASDSRLAPLLSLAREHQITVVLGAPLLNGMAKPFLGAIVLGPHHAAQTYCKMHLGGNEPAYFAPGNSPCTLIVEGQTIGLAICADASQPSHPQTYAESGADIYAAGVFLNEEWYKTDAPRLASYAARHRLLIVMANHAASVGTQVSVGMSAIWAPDGRLLAQATSTENSLIIAARGRDGWRGEAVAI
ncbi:carbon-nitrogen hydrolase family protein [Planctomicrobium piriforme]|uniref:Predicted amidohydrolase n=1 Tax=Planctomicrobium piriforme TaxID=1576369 RepID=A0A1I3PA13_9PLAN|nr:carbon-nitrogen hydrolase family protein [Planctomicrobium piriforme]SFJ18269.1 Predicted amidohydrolase [Planctomicrobium piriforme]